MNINDLLSNRRDELIQESVSEYMNNEIAEDDVVEENDLGDITGEEELDYELLCEALDLLEDGDLEITEEGVKSTAKAAGKKVKGAAKGAYDKYENTMANLDAKIYKFIFNRYKTSRAIRQQIENCEACIEELEAELRSRDTEGKSKKIARTMKRLLIFAILPGYQNILQSTASKRIIKRAISTEKIVIKHLKKRLKELEKEEKAYKKGKKKAVKESYSIFDDEVEYYEDDDSDLFVEESASDEEFFDEEELKEIALEELNIDDPDEYIANAIDEFGNETLAIIGEMYIDELITEEAIELCENYEDLDSIEEAFKEGVKEKAKKAGGSISALAKKFAAWIQSLITAVTNLFASGEKLVKKYQGKIVAEYNSRGPKIKVKTYMYKHDMNKMKSLLKSIIDANIKAGDGLNSTKSDESLKSVKEKAVACIRQGEKREYRITDISIKDILMLAGEKQSIISTLQDANKTMQNTFKQAMGKVKNEAPEGTTKEQAKNSIGAIKYASKSVTTAINAYIAEVKAANRAYTAIVRKLLNTNKKPNAPEPTPTLGSGEEK